MASTIQKGVNYAKELAETLIGGDCHMIILYVVSVIFIVILSYSLYLRTQLTKGDTQKKLMIKYE